MGNRVRGKYLFEPVYGNGRHVGLGGSLDFATNLWESDKGTLDIVSAVRYKYLFENAENRTLNVKGFPFSQYYLVGKNGVANQTLFPAANILTTPIAVKPGSMLDWTTILSFNSNGFTIDAGYNLFWRDRETVHIKGSFDGTYGIATADFQTTTSPASSLASIILLSNQNLNLEAVRTPALFSNKLFASLGYTFNECSTNPISLGLGGSYEFATSNADIENYAIWGKVIFSF
jgi:hypothetical protein